MKKLLTLVLIVISFYSCKKEEEQDENNPKNYLVEYRVKSTIDGINLTYKTSQGYGFTTVNTGNSWSKSFISAPDSTLFFSAFTFADTSYRTMSIYIYMDNVLLKSKTKSGNTFFIQLEDTIH